MIFTLPLTRLREIGRLTSWGTVVSAKNAAKWVRPRIKRRDKGAVEGPKSQCGTARGEVCHMERRRGLPPSSP
jgi:hypothetical protein